MFPSSPQAAAAVAAGERIGVDEDGDRSVVATGFVLGGLAAGAAHYALCAGLAAWAAGPPRCCGVHFCRL